MLLTVSIAKDQIGSVPKHECFETLYEVNVDNGMCQMPEDGKVLITEVLKCLIRPFALITGKDSVVCKPTWETPSGILTAWEKVDSGNGKMLWFRVGLTRSELV